MTQERGAGARHLARELLVKALYQWQMAGHSVAEISAQFAAHEDFERSDRDFFGQLLAVTIEDAPAPAHEPGETQWGFGDARPADESA